MPVCVGAKSAVVVRVAGSVEDVRAGVVFWSSVRVGTVLMLLVLNALDFPPRLRRAGFLRSDFLSLAITIGLATPSQWFSLLLSCSGFVHLLPSLHSGI